MSTRTRTQVEVTTETAVNWVNNEMMSGFISIANAAGADIGWLVNNRDRLTNAISTWLENKALSELELQVRTRDERILDSYVFDVSYEADRGYVEFPVEEVKRSVDYYSQDVYIYVSPLTYENRRSRDFGYEFSDVGERNVRNLTSFGAGHINVDVGKVVQSNDVGFAGALAVFAVAGAGLGLFWVLMIAISGAFMELFSFVLPTGIVDLMEVTGILALGLMAYGVAAESLDGIGIYAAVPAFTFLYTAVFLLPLRYVAPFGMVGLPTLVAFGVSALAVLGELVE